MFCPRPRYRVCEGWFNFFFPKLFCVCVLLQYFMHSLIHRNSHCVNPFQLQYNASLGKLSYRKDTLWDTLRDAFIVHCSSQWAAAAVLPASAGWSCDCGHGWTWTDGWTHAGVDVYGPCTAIAHLLLLLSLCKRALLSYTGFKPRGASIISGMTNVLYH